MQTLSDFYHQSGLQPFPIDGKFRNQHHLWCIGWQSTSGAVNILAGDWRTGARFAYEGKESGEITDEDREEWKRLEKEAQAAQEKLHLEASLEAGRLWDDASPTGTHAYLSSKKIDLLGARIIYRDNQKQLIVPMYYEGTISGIQFISESGYKAFLEGSRMKGSYHVIGDIKDIIYIAEGYATAVSIHMATGEAVACAFNAGNLRRTAVSLMSSGKRLVICADDDYKTPGNPGQMKAREAASKSGAYVVSPKFPRGRAGETDFNDLHVRFGLAEVANCISSQLDSSLPANIPDLKCLIKISPNGKTILPADSVVADAILHAVGDRWRANKDDVFTWEGTHWRERSFDIFSRDMIPSISRALGNEYQESKAKSILGLLVRLKLRSMGDSIYQSNCSASAFRNGTLRISGTSYEGFHVSFDPGHSPDDNLMTCLPFDFHKDAEDPKELISYLKNGILSESENQAEDLLMIQEIFGACMLPFFPLIVFFSGKPKTGKSTIVKLITSFISKENTCNVDPTNMHGFNMENMLGKSVNILTDLNTSRVIDVDTVKLIEDRHPIQVQRKYRTNAQAFIPAVHIFATNSMPRLGDESSGALERRVRVFHCNKTITQKTILDYHLGILAREQREIISWAYRGIQRVAENGGYSYPAHLAENARAWEQRDDRVEQFLKSVTDGETNLALSDTGEIPRTLLRDTYLKWSDTMKCKVSPTDLNRLYSRYPQKKVQGTRYIKGFISREAF